MVVPLLGLHLQSGHAVPEMHGSFASPRRPPRTTGGAWRQVGPQATRGQNLVAECSPVFLTGQPCSTTDRSSIPWEGARAVPAPEAAWRQRIAYWSGERPRPGEGRAPGCVEHIDNAQIDTCRYQSDNEN